MANLYAPVIVNNQRTSNTSVQASTLQSTSNLHNQLSLQSFRTVQGYIYFPNSSGTGVVVNQYDLSPVSFNSGDIVLAMSVSNGSPAYPGSDLPTPFISTGQTGPSIEFWISKEPTYNNSAGWIPGSNSIQLSASVDPTNLGNSPPSMSNPSNPPVSLKVPLLFSRNGIATQTSTDPEAQWLNCTYSLIEPSVTPTTMAVNVTLLVINASIAQ
jgi:hypothetical protein